MTHPAFRPAALARGNDVGRAIRFPPVLVQDEQQRLFHESRGYQETSMINPRTFDPETAEPEAYVVQEYPRWERGVLVQNEQQHRAQFPEDFETA